MKKQIDKFCIRYVCVEMHDFNEALDEMKSEGLILVDGDIVELTGQGARLDEEWKSLLLKQEPIMEVVAGLADGSITGLVVILSALVAGLDFRITAFASLLTLASVAITNFSSFLLGGITEDLAEMVTLQNLMNYSVSDIPDKKERTESLTRLKALFTLLHKEISRSNLLSAIVCATTTFLAGITPILAYLLLPKPFGTVLSLGIASAVVGVFLVRYRAKRSRVHWKVTFYETVAIVAIAVVASLIIGGTVSTLAVKHKHSKTCAERTFCQDRSQVDPFGPESRSSFRCPIRSRSSQEVCRFDDIAAILTARFSHILFNNQHIRRFFARLSKLKLSLPPRGFCQEIGFIGVVESTVRKLRWRASNHIHCKASGGMVI